MREILFIGGTYDGRRLEVAEGVMSVSVPTASPHVHLEYKREKVVDMNQTKIEVMFHQDGTNLIRKLIDGYKAI